MSSFIDVTTFPDTTPPAASRSSNDLLVQDGCYYSVPDSIYFALDKYTSSHSSNPESGDFDEHNPFIQRALKFGTATHSAILENDLSNFRTLPADDQKKMIEMIKSYKVNQEAIDLVKGCRAEVVVICNDFHGARVRAKMDGLNIEDGIIIDLKTCADFDKFKLSVYAWQMAFYRSLMQHMYPHPRGYYSIRVIVLEKKMPHRCETMKPSFAELVVKEKLIAEILSNRVEALSQSDSQPTPLQAP